MNNHTHNAKSRFLLTVANTSQTPPILASPFDFVLNIVVYIFFKYKRTAVYGKFPYLQNVFRLSPTLLTRQQ